MEIQRAMQSKVIRSRSPACRCISARLLSHKNERPPSLHICYTCQNVTFISPSDIERPVHKLKLNVGPQAIQTSAISATAFGIYRAHSLCRFLLKLGHKALPVNQVNFLRLFLVFSRPDHRYQSQAVLLQSSWGKRPRDSKEVTMSYAREPSPGNNKIHSERLVACIYPLPVSSDNYK